jgi:hypothetical protein
MPENESHWPFGDSGSGDTSESSREAELERKRVEAARKEADKRQMRTNRLIVGGRAHTKKQGLS